MAYGYVSLTVLTSTKKTAADLFGTQPVLSPEIRVEPFQHVCQIIHVCEGAEKFRRRMKLRCISKRTSAQIFRYCKPTACCRPFDFALFRRCHTHIDSLCPFSHIHTCMGFGAGPVCAASAAAKGCRMATQSPCSLQRSISEHTIMWGMPQCCRTFKTLRTEKSFCVLPVSPIAAQQLFRTDSQFV